MKIDNRSPEEQQLAEELAEAKEQLLDFFDRFGEIYFWKPARKARVIALTAMLTNFLVSINAGFISAVRPEALSLNFDLAEWAFHFTAACSVYYLVLLIFSQISLSLEKGEKLVLNGVLASLVFTLSIFSSLIGFFDSLTWFIFFLYTMLGFVLLDWRQVVITDTSIIVCMILISIFHEQMPFPVQAYMFSEGRALNSLTLLDMISGWSITATAAFSGMWIMSFLLRNWHVQGIEQVSMAHFDPLTRLMKRRAVLDAFEDEVQKAAREKAPLTVAVIDLDKFKALNAEYGHVFGDQMLVHFAQQLGQITRREDLVGRYGGQEFIVVFPYCRSEIAIQILERLRKQLDDNPLEHQGNLVSLSFSAGVSYLRTGDHKYENVIARADRALSKVKALGGRQILDDDANT
jgi:diguanylate cyclase (GGDEF)-like protein